MNHGQQPQPGDIILYTVTPKSGWTSKLVAVGELFWGAGRGAKAYSHAAVLSYTKGRQFEAKWPLTGFYPVDSSRPYEVWRITGVTDEQRKAVLRWCQAHTGQLYDMVGLLTFGLIRSRHRAVCSQFVGRAYAAAGIRIAPEGKRLLSPNAIADFKRARLVGTFMPRTGWVGAA